MERISRRRQIPLVAPAVHQLHSCFWRFFKMLLALCSAYRVSWYHSSHLLLLKGSRVFQNIGFLLNFLAVKLTQTSWIGWSSFSMSSDKEILQLAMKSSGGIVESWNTVNPTWNKFIRHSAVCLLAFTLIWWNDNLWQRTLTIFGVLQLFS